MVQLPPSHRHPPRSYAQPLADWNFFSARRYESLTAALESCALFPGLDNVLDVAVALGMRVDVELKPESPMADPWKGCVAVAVALAVAVAFWKLFGRKIGFLTVLE
jgi:hypothetical protein